MSHSRAFMLEGHKFIRLCLKLDSCKFSSDLAVRELFWSSQVWSRREGQVSQHFDRSSFIDEHVLTSGGDSFELNRQSSITGNSTVFELACSRV